MEISTSVIDGVTVAAFAGNLDTNTAPEGQAKLDEIIDGGATKILVDFTSLDYISSAGLRVLLVTGKKLKASGGAMRNSNLNETVAEVFEISGFSTIFNVFGDRSEALAGF